MHDNDKHRLIQVPLHKVQDRWTFDLDAMEAALTPQTRLLMLCSPHNPVGTVFTPEELNAVCQLAKKNNILVVSDEIHSGLVLNEDKTPHTVTALACPEYANGIITLMSQSKTFNLAGMNCSVAIISDPQVRQQFKSACVEVMPGVTTMAYESATAAFREGEPWRQALLEYLRGNHEFLQESLQTIPGLHLGRCDATYLAWIDATELGLDDTTAFFEQAGVGLSSGEQFGQAQFIRLNFACPRSILAEGVDRIRRAVATLPTVSSG